MAGVALQILEHDEPTTIAVKNRIRCMRSRTAGTSWTAS